MTSESGTSDRSMKRRRNSAESAMNQIANTSGSSPDENPVQAPKRRCSFCNKPQEEVPQLIAGPCDVYICSHCVALCREILEEEKAEQASPGEEMVQLSLDVWSEIIEVSIRTAGQLHVIETMKKSADEIPNLLSPELYEQLSQAKQRVVQELQVSIRRIFRENLDTFIENTS